MKEVSDAEESERREGASEEKALKAKKRRGQEIKRAKGGARKDKMYKSDVREEGRGRDLLEERLSQVVPGQSLIRFKSN